MTNGGYEVNADGKVAGWSAQGKYTFRPGEGINGTGAFYYENDNPKYYIHFTLSKLVDGELQLQTFPEEATQQDFKKGVEMDKGEYVLTTGVRMASGKVLARMQRFTLSGDTTIAVPSLINAGSW